MNKHLLKSLLFIATLVMGTGNAWALTVDLSMDYELTGYKAAAFYDFSTNDPAVLPESGDLRFRSTYGLYNFGSGNRGGDVSISVKQGQVLVCQFADTQNRSVTINSISGCTKSSTLSDGSHLFFVADDDNSTLNFNVGRAGCIVSLLVMDVDNSVTKASYTLNYIIGELVVKSENGELAVGATVPTDASFFVEDTKYIRADGEPESLTIADGENNFSVKVRLAETFNYSLANSLGTTLASGEGFEGENVSVGYPRYLLSESKFYEAAATNKEYRKAIALTQNNASATVDYSEWNGTNAVVFYAEGENITDFTTSVYGNIPVRASNAKAGTASEDVTITTLSAGKYKLHVGTFTSKSSEQNIYIGYGETQYAFASSSNLNESASEEFTLVEETDIKYFGTTSSADAQFDYIWIEKTGDVEVVTDPNDFTSYIVNADLTGEGGFDATGTKGIDGSGVVKVGNAAAFDFKQTIANLPAGKYKVTAQAAYRYGADEAAEAAAIAAETDTKLVQLYATVGEKTVSAKVQNRYDGASETDYANGDGSVTVNEKFVPNSSNAVKAWFAAGLYVNEVVFNLPADGAVTIGINRTGTPESDYTVIGPWTLTRIGDAEEDPEPETPALTNGDFEGEYTVFASPKSDRDILQPAGWTVTYQNGDENDMTALNSSDKAWSNFENKPQLGETSDNNTYWVRFRWGNSETLTLSQQVILPAGNYKLSADAFFNGANGASATISAAGQSVNVAGNSTWTNHKVIFTVTEEGPVTISLNVTQTQQVENIAAFDNVKLEGVEDIYADLKVEVTAALEAKQSIKTKNALDAALATFTAEQNETNAEVLKAALATTKASINSYKILETGIIPDDKLDGWTCTNSNTFHINTWSGEGNSDGSNMKTPFIENWCNKNDGYLGTGEIFYSLPGLDPGIYQFSALIRAYSEAGNALTGASLFAGNREKEFATGKNFEYNGMKGIYDTYTMATEVGEDGIFRFGIKIAENRNFNWMAFKNCKVAYVGNAIDEAAINELAATMPEGKMNAEVKAAAETAIAAAKENMGLDTYEAAMKAITAAQASADAYAATNEILTKMKQLTEETNVYTAEALETYYTQWFDKYNAGTLTVEEGSALQDPFRITGWRTAITCDNFLLSAWDTTPDFPDGVAYYINTWSNEGESDGSNFKVPFFEYFGSPLAEKTLTATMNGLQPGDYKVTALVRVAPTDKTAEAANGVTLQVNDGEAVDVCTGEKFDAEKERFFIKEFTAEGTVAEDGVLNIKFHVAEGNNIHWLSFKNVKFEKKPELILTLQGTIGEEVSLTFGAYDTEDTYGVDFGDGNVVEKKVGVNNAGPYNEEKQTTDAATVFTGTVAGDGTIKVYGINDIWYLVSSGAMPTTLNQEKLMNVVQMSITGANVESVELPAYEKMTQFSFNNSPAKSVDVSKVTTLTSLNICNTSVATTDMMLESIDLSKNTNLENLVLGGTYYKKGVLKTVDLSANTALKQIVVANQDLESIILPEGANLTSGITVSMNKLTALDLSKLAGFKNIEANDNLLTEIDLSKLATGSNVKVQNNLLTTLAVSVSVADFDASNNKLTTITIENATKSCKLENNAFTLATLPAQPAGMGTKKKTQNFTYAPQAALEVAETVSELDLTSQLTVAKGELNPAAVGTEGEEGYAAAYGSWIENQTTTFTFVTGGETPATLVEGTDYEVVEPGKFKFIKAQAEKVHAVMTNAAFPKFTGDKAFMTTEFTVDVDPIAGDANLNGEVTTSDAVAAVSFALGTETPSAKAFKAADVDNSGEITVTDAVAIVNIALEIEPEAPARGEMAEAMNFLTMNGNALELTNTTTFVGFQMDVTLANGAMLNGVSLSERAAGLQVAYNRIADNTYRIIAFSTSNTAIEGIDGTLFSLDITGNANINITNIEFADAAARAYALGFGEATGIKGINADATNVEIYTVDGVKSNKVRKGINVVRTADGKVKKVFVK